MKKKKNDNGNTHTEEHTPPPFYRLYVFICSFPVITHLTCVTPEVGVRYVNRPSPLLADWGRVALDDCYGKTLSSPPLIQYGDKPTPQKGEIVTCTLQPLTIKY